MYMGYGILDVSAGEESLTVLFFSDMHPMRAPAAFIVQGCRDFCFAIFRKYAQKSDSKLAKLTLTKGGQIVYNKAVTNI